MFIEFSGSEGKVSVAVISITSVRPLDDFLTEVSWLVKGQRLSKDELEVVETSKLEVTLPYNEVMNAITAVASRLENTNQQKLTLG